MVSAIVLAALAAASPEVTQAQAKEILAHGYQTELPRATTEPSSVSLGPPDHARDDAIQVSSSPVTRSLLWVVIGGAVVLLLAFGLSEGLGKKGASGKAPPSPSAAGDDAALIERPLGDAEALAREGRFGEAIHVLLLRTLAELARRVAVPTSLTSREILAQAELPGDARDALRSLVVAVEVSHFGDKSPGRADYDACVGRFRAFVDAYQGLPVAA